MSDSRTLTNTLGGHWHGYYGTAPCPVCQPEHRKDQNALTLRDGEDGRLLLHCKRLGCAFRTILRAVTIAPGAYQRPHPADLLKRKETAKAEAAKKSAQAEGLWREAQPITGTIAETYMHEVRGITCALPDTLRFHPSCWHGPSASRQPALVAIVEGSHGFAVHRTYLRRDGSAKAALKPNKMMLGSTRGGGVRLSEGMGSLIVGEGIESTLSAFVQFGEPVARAWASLSTSGMRALRLPKQPARLIIAPDGDAAGHAAALSLKNRGRREGWSVSVLAPPPGGDFNDLMNSEVLS
ncbi:toprim domain-containing protein [Mameliella alba]|uniref:DUF7146 domain-containing protein n=1 Tax=Mameliella alba TaxID=561184 RepID=UPI0014322CF7|nr:toprim domain-containing protein [Mameliella alba]MBY6117837.1 toprim domain-containing protein [Mameliella alba]